MCRCGIIHARGPPPATKVSQNDLLDYIRLFENKMSTFLQPTQTLDAEELTKLGAKDCDGEVKLSEYFVEKSHIVTILMHILYRLKNLFKQTHKNYLRINGCAHCLEKNSKDLIL